MSFCLNLHKVIDRTANKYFSIIKRNLLSPKFVCSDEWDKRLTAPVFKRIKIDDFYHDIDQKYNQTGKISAIDLDIFANALSKDSHLDELEDLIHKFRLSASAGYILPSTHHGFIRIFMENKKYDELLRILNDRLNYGIFPDDYCTIIIMDKFIKDKNFKNAAKVATMHMLQEDFSNDLISYMSLYSCHKYLIEPTEWEPVSSEKDDENDEEVKVRVRYIRNQYFDDHFDLREANHLIGKTLSLIGECISTDLGRSYSLLGKLLHEEFSKAHLLLQNFIESKHCISRDTYKLMVDSIESLKNKCSSDKDKLSKLNGMVNLLEQIKEKNLFCDDALSTVEELIKSEVKQKENELIKKQIKTYNQWINSRDVLLNKELEESRKEIRLEEIKKAKEALAKKEEELFFFDRENELDLKIESKIVDDPPDKINGKTASKKVTEDDDYIPPEISKQKDLG